MFIFKNAAATLLVAIVLLKTPSVVAAAGYSFVEGYNVLDTNNAPAVGTNFAATAGLERDIAVDSARGIIYMARGATTGASGAPDGRPGGIAGVAAIIATNGARVGSNFRDTGLITAAGGQTAVGFHQSLAFDPVSDK